MISKVDLYVIIFAIQVTVSIDEDTNKYEILENQDEKEKDGGEKKQTANNGKAGQFLFEVILRFPFFVSFCGRWEERERNIDIHIRVYASHKH